MADLTIKEDSIEKWSGTVSHAGSDPPLQGATALVIYLRAVGASVNKVDGKSVTILDATLALATWEWTPVVADVDTAGIYQVYMRATYSGAETKRFPSKGYVTVEIEGNFE